MNENEFCYTSRPVVELEKHVSVSKHRIITAALAALVAAVAAQGVHAHGDVDATVAEFHEHLDDYETEIDAFVAELPALLRAYRAGEDVAAMTDGLIDRWEAVAVHGAIETHATITYPGIWQALVSLQQATQEADAADRVADAAERVRSALWQGFGALRLAAAQVESGTYATAPKAESSAALEDVASLQDAPVSGQESIDRIVAELDDAVTAYADGEAERAASMVEAAYMQRFEYLEGDLIEYDADLVTALEKDFNATLPLLMQQGAPVQEVRAALAQMKDALGRARTLLAQAERSRSRVF